MTNAVSPRMAPGAGITRTTNASAGDLGATPLVLDKPLAGARA